MTTNTFMQTGKLALAVLLGLSWIAVTPAAGLAADITKNAEGVVAADAGRAAVRYRSLQVNGVNIAYREAGDPAQPTILLLHGFPTSSHMFRRLIPELAGRYHVVAPDYPGFGNSEMPAIDKFDYSFANFAETIESFLEAKQINRYALYLMDYGAPVGFRLFARNPGRVTGFIIQNGNAYEEGLKEFWDPIKAYWAAPTTENGDKLRPFFELDVTR